MTSVSLRPPSVKPSPKTAPPPGRDYEFNPAPKEISRRKDVSGDAKILFGVLLNDARFRTGGNVSRASNERLMEEAGYEERKLQRVLKDLERLGLIRRAFRKSGQVHRDYIEITWIPSEPKAGEDVISFGVSNLSPQNQEGGLARQNCHPGTTNLTPWHDESDVPSTTNLTCIKEEKRERISERTSTPSPSPTRPGSEPSPSSPNTEDGTGLPDGWNVTLPPERSAEILRDMIGRAVQTPEDSPGRTPEGRRPISPGAIRAGLQDARRAGRGTTRKRSRDELLDQVETLRARTAARAAKASLSPQRPIPSPAPDVAGLDTGGPFSPTGP